MLQPMPLLITLMGLGLPPSVVQQFLSALVGATATGLFAFFAGRHTAAAQLQTSINGAFQLLMKEWQDRHSADTARILELEEENRNVKRARLVAESEITSLRGENRQLHQRLHHYEQTPIRDTPDDA